MILSAIILPVIVICVIPYAKFVITKDYYYVSKRWERMLKKIDRDINEPSK